MALTAIKMRNLTEHGFLDLFARHRELWEAKARQAYAYTKDLVEAAGLPIRPDDLIDLLVPALDLSDEFRSFLEERRLQQKYWRVQFAELVIDQLWGELVR